MNETQRLTGKWIRLARALGAGPAWVCDSAIDPRMQVLQFGQAWGRCDKTMAEFIVVSKKLAELVEKENPDVTPGF